MKEKSSNQELYRKPPDPKRFDHLLSPFGENEKMDIQNAKTEGESAKPDQRD